MTRRAVAALVALGLGAAGWAQAPQASFDTAEWRAIVERLASDEFAGRETGTRGYDLSAAYVADRFRAAGLRPGGDGGTWFQEVRFVRQTVLASGSKAALTIGGRTTPLSVGGDVIAAARTALPPRGEGTLEFVGYGLHLPVLRHDDLAGRDLRGKVVVFVRGVPKGLDPVAVADGYGQVLPRKLKEMGAIGSIQLAAPGNAPSAPAAVARDSSGFHLADEATEGVAAMSLHPRWNETLFAGVPGGFAPLTALVRDGAPLPRAKLDGRFAATLTTRKEAVTSRNVVGVLPGADAKLRGESVVLSAHLDHLGIAPGRDDKPAIYRGVMDNASGVATMIQVAAALAKEPRTRRSLVFVALTGEEKGLLGSKAFAARPPAPAGRLVANVNMDMYLPLAPMRRLIVQGADESSLGPAARASAAALGVEVIPDPRPQEFRFIRSDQYSFIQQGVPAIAHKIEPPAGTPDAEYRLRWDRERYHSPADDLSQPISLDAVVAFNRYLMGTIRRVADARDRPRWNATSYFAGRATR